MVTRIFDVKLQEKAIGNISKVAPSKALIVKDCFFKKMGNNCVAFNLLQALVTSTKDVCFKYESNGVQLISANVPLQEDEKSQKDWSKIMDKLTKHCGNCSYHTNGMKITYVQEPQTFGVNSLYKIKTNKINEMFPIKMNQIINQQEPAVGKYLVPCSVFCGKLGKQKNCSENKNFTKPQKCDGQFFGVYTTQALKKISTR